MISVWPDSPRDWSPRMEQALKDLETLRATIPPELLVDRADLFTVGHTFKLPGDGEEVAMRVALIVKVGEARSDRVWLYSDGKLGIGVGIVTLLQGGVEGYEHLEGRWPWPGAYGPPGTEVAW